MKNTKEVCTGVCRRLAKEKEYLEAILFVGFV